LKIDLHTHLHEATNFVHPTPAVVEKVVSVIKAKGLDGIAITDHAGKITSYPFQVMDIVEQHFNNDILIIPGREINKQYMHIVELLLPEKRIFRFIAHPGYPVAKYWDEHLDGIHGLEINNGMNPIDGEKVRRLAKKHGLLLLSNSDAHRLEDIGKYYTEIDFDELCDRAREAEQKVQAQTYQA
jgi:histidinol phosphatase-like PHP family hydrolase